MNILILGASGMLGHKIQLILGNNSETYGTVRKKSELLKESFFREFKIIEGVSAEKISSVKKALETSDADIAINCIGIVKQLPEAKNPVISIRVNSLFPHELAQLCSEQGTRLIHYSTDCVFSGKTGEYTEESFPDADDLYGRSKLLGEVTGKNCLTLRTSIVGRELTGSHGLIEWFLSHRGKTVKGYKNAIFSGLTTGAHARILKEILVNHPGLEGLYHLAGDPISKYDLLNLVKEQYALDVNIEPEFQEVSNRSLDSSKFISATKIIIPDWNEMIREMHQDPTPYDIIRSHHAVR